MLSPTTPLTDSVVTSLNQFGLKLFRQLCAADGELTQNVVMSPFSVAAALTMVFDGATGGTRDEMARTLGLEGMSRDEVNAAYAGLIAALTSADQDTLLEIANSLWAKKNIQFPIRPEYIERNRVNFQAEIAEIEFNAAGIKTINDWVNNRTHAKIPSIIEILNPLSAMVLLNAVYFKAKWEEPFDSRRTKLAPFMLKNGQQRLCLMMMAPQSMPWPYYKDEHIQAVRLPYQGEQASMVIMMPSRELGLDGLLAQLTGDQWNGWLDHMSQPAPYVIVEMPRFKTEFDVQLRTTLTTLGMDAAFDFDRAEFEEIGPKGDWCIGEVQHKAFLDVTEEGTEAAAATKVEMYGRGLPEFVTMTVDRPFFLAIVDDRTRAILFAGAITDPGEPDDPAIDAGDGKKSLNVRYNDRLVYSERVKSDDAE